MTKTFVHNGKEVVLTGRTAKKKMPSGKEQILYEISPNNAITKQYNTWVLLKDLYEITPVPEESQDDAKP